MDYKKKYKEANDKVAIRFGTNVAKEIFTDLYESEDEKIRKALVRFHKSSIDIDGIKGEDILAWLEKQGEQKPFDYENANIQQKDFAPKVEPKFKVGDWIVYNRDDYSREIMQIYDIRDGRYYFTDNIHFSWSIKECDEKCHLWSIKDAMDGDVLVEDSCIFIIQKLGDNSTAAKTYCTLYNDGDFDDGSILYFDVDSTKPATKEQCDFLFSKMKEAGYEWDAEKKEKKKIEQKPFDYENATIVQKDFAPKTEPKFHKGEWLCENEPNNYARFIQILETVNVQGKERYRISRDIHNDEDIVEFDFVEKYYHKFDIQDAKDGDVLATKSGKPFIFKGLLDKFYTESPVAYCGIATTDDFFLSTGGGRWTHEEAKPATKEQRDTLMKAMADAGWEFDFEKKELKKIEQKLAWSEEDEKHIDSLLERLEGMCKKGATFTKTRFAISQDMDWLKSLKDRIGG